MKNKKEQSYAEKHGLKLKISKQERLVLLGLMYLANEAYKQSKACDDAMNTLLGAKEEWGTLLSDEWLQEKPNLDKTLKNMGIKIV